MINHKDAEQAINYLKELRKLSKDENSDWKPSEVEEWKEDHLNFSSSNHYINFRRSSISGGTINPPDRPFKTTSKYDGLQKNVEDWFGGINLFDRLKGLFIIIKSYCLYKNRLRSKKIKSNDFMGDDLYGNPIYYKIPLSKIKITEASIRYWYYSNILSYHFEEPSTIIEIGSGYGGLCKRVKELINPKKYIIVDLLENLSLAFCYHKSLSLSPIYLINSKKDFYKLKNDGIFLLAPWLLNDLEVNIDLCINTMSFQHMNRKNIRYYFKFIQSNCNALYHVNRNIKRDSSDLEVSDYPMLASFQYIVNKPFITNTHQEVLLKKK